jgi:hypothetical protein
MGPTPRTPVTPACRCSGRRQRVRKKTAQQELFYRSEKATQDLDREIEKRVAEVIRRSPIPWRNPPRYTTELVRAQFLLDVMERREGGATTVVETPSGWACSVDFGGEDAELIVGRGDTEALAICAAFMSKRPRRRARRRYRGFAAELDHAVFRVIRRVWNHRFVVRLRKETRKLLFP